MYWFEAKAPIRLKLLFAFAVMVALVATSGILSFVFSGWAMALAGGLLTALAAILGIIFRRAIADPYVGTVVRMEGLAAGDVASSIEFTDYEDCVGRLSRAMLTFRDAAVEQRRQGEEAVEIVGVLSGYLRELSEGNLTAQITSEFPPAYAALKTNFNQALEALRELIGAVHESAAQIQTGSGEIAQASEDLARRTEGNAASLEETSASLIQIDGRLKATATAASRTVERADQANGTVGVGRKVAEEAVEAMGRVSQSAEGIDSVIEGLDKIAFQTRVLAMNAAVEAGRAGDAGRGFAVVADLVSALAMRAEEEAKRARDQLTVTQTDIGTAVEAVQKVDGALVAISGDVEQVHKLLESMASDNQAQSAGITEISTAISTMDQSTQQNAAMVEETSAAARNLTHEVQALAEQAGRFHVGADRIPAGQLRAAPGGANSSTSPQAKLPVQALAHLKTVTPQNDWNEF